MVSLFKESIYRMPAEWEKQKSTWIAWPHNKSDWPNKFRLIPDVFAEIISQISKVQKVNIIVENIKSRKNIISFLKNYNVNNKNLKFIRCKTDRVWLRDSFPLFIKDKNNKKVLLNWEFNAWAKYKNFKKDNAIYNKIKKISNLKTIKPILKKRKIVLEGGSIDIDGKGTLLTTKECLLSKSQERNPGFKKKEYELIFNKYLGVKKVLWLNKGIVGDDTHGHIDDIARFVNEKKIFIAYENNKKDINYKNLKENFKIINKMNKKKKFKIIKLPMPDPKFFEGIRVPASYLNFYIANKIVLVPVFKDKKDKKVLKIFRKHFHKRKIIPIDCSILIWGLGAIHCMTQQEPI
tara:strand:- start:426 stop:1472 length:1047 start_codon:yes stop_codon:yes gene_type:complete